MAEGAADLGPEQGDIQKVVDCFAARRFAEALERARTMIERWPRHAFGWKAFGAAQVGSGRFLEGMQALKTALDLQPLDPEVHGNMADALAALGQLQPAEAHYRRALELKPDLHHARRMLGGVQKAMGRLAEAEESYRRAVELKPDFYDALNDLGVLLMDVGRFSEALAAYSRALDLRPAFAVAHINLGNARAALGQLGEAEKLFRRSVELQPDWLEARSNHLFFLAYTDFDHGAGYLARARQWETGIPAVVREGARAKTFPRRAQGRRLRVGYLSGDFRAHPVSVFMEPLLRNHDRRRVEIFAYHASAKEDVVTARLREHAEHWRVVTNLADQAVVDLVAQDQIDVLVDLAGHARHNRLGVFARRAAPVQCHYLGYYASTGLTEMDYWVADPVLVPEGSESEYCESIWRLPRTWVAYAPPVEVPAPAAQPCSRGRICLGSFNHLGKVTPRTIALWASVLGSIPNTYLLLKTWELGDPSNTRRLVEEFGKAGIPPDRLELLGRTPQWTAHMATYNRVDIALDPAGGAAGGTTTCEALWMGVPVVTLSGRRHGERMTTSMLASIGHAEWGTRDEAEYVERVRQLAEDPALRQHVRSTLREEVRASALADVAGLARTLEDAYEAMRMRAE